jgi:putative MATE family efflux protein
MAPIGAPTPLAGPLPSSARAEFAALARLAGPLVAANLVQMAVYAVDVVFVARLGTAEFAAATLAVFLYSVSMWALISTVGAGAPLIAAELGRRAHAVREVRRTFRMSCWLAVLGAAPLLTVLWNGEAVLRLAGQDPHVAHRAGQFLRVLMWALIPGGLSGAMRNAAAALGRPGWSLVVSCVALGCGILGNWCLVFGHAGLPALGLIGSATASVGTVLAMTLAYLVILHADPRLRRYRLWGRWWRPEWRRLGEIARLGWPIALSVILEAGLFGGAALLMGLIGIVAVAAHSVALNIASVTFQVPFGVAQAATIRVGLGFGARDPGAVRRAGLVALATGTGFMLVAASLIGLFPRVVIAGYLDVRAPANAPVVALAARLLLVAAAFQLFDGAQAVLQGMLRGVQDTRAPMLIALGSYWGVGFGVAAWLAFGRGWGGVGVWSGFVVGLANATALLGWRWRSRRGRLAPA